MTNDKNDKPLHRVFLDYEYVPIWQMKRLCGWGP